MRAVRGLLAAVLAAGIVTVVAAQPGGGGFGRGTQDTFITVLTNKALQEEVKVTDEQKTKFKSISEKQRELQQKQFEGLKDVFSKFKDASDDEKKEMRDKMTKEGEKVTAEIKKLVEAELTADQKTRLKQIYVQALRLNAFTNEDVLKDLGATDAQKGTFKTIVTDFTKDEAEVRKDIFGEPKGGKGGFGGFGKQDPEKTKEFNSKRDKLTKEAMSKVTETLSDDQKKKWTEMTGAAFDLSKLTQFGGFPGGGGFGKDKTKKKDDE